MLRKSKSLGFIIAVILLLGASITIIFSNKKESNEFKLDKEDKYIVITDMKYNTMQNDGGSHTNLYYELDTNKNIVNIITEEYHANIGGTPEKKKTTDTKQIAKELSKELRDLLTNLFAKEDIKNINDYAFYTIKTKNTTKNIYNQDSINSLKSLLERIK